MVFETLRTSGQGAVLFVDIAAPPMSLLGAEMVCDLASLIQESEADTTIKVTPSMFRGRSEALRRTVLLPARRLCVESLYGGNNGHAKRQNSPHQRHVLFCHRVCLRL